MNTYFIHCSYICSIDIYSNVQLNIMFTLWKTFFLGKKPRVLRHKEHTDSNQVFEVYIV
jgi:hypothetical protein